MQFCRRRKLYCILLIVGFFAAFVSYVTIPDAVVSSDIIVNDHETEGARVSQKNQDGASAGNGEKHIPNQNKSLVWQPIEKPDDQLGSQLIENRGYGHSQVVVSTTTIENGQDNLDWTNILEEGNVDTTNRINSGEIQGDKFPGQKDNSRSQADSVQRNVTETKPLAVVSGAPGDETTINSNIFVERSKRRAEVCRNHPSLSGDILKYIRSFDPLTSLVMETQYIVYSDFNVLYCQVPKAASTNFKRLFLLAEGSKKSKKIGNGTLDLMKLSPSATWGKTRTTSIRLQNVNESFARNVVRNFTKVLIVRHPLERLISYYRMAFETTAYENFNNKGGAKALFAHVQSQYKRPVPKFAKQSETPHLSFEEFVQFVIDSDASIRNRSWTMHHLIDAHWMPVSRQCHPCALDYDFICKVETLDTDLKLLAKHLGIAKAIKYPEQLKRTSHGFLNEYLTKLPPAQMEKLVNVFKLDFELFGYKTEIE
ncbi:carbohydrate sulfotransferase 12 isoform X2 [Lingula anatina]|uniref:Carbohydrate sulfotransferase n=1 Tax=Lingula anatina TaxID=7574 RepID=A0A1S3J3K2_LINAN|nr:carbohydrate sulfotransferase 12 isoform X1 [Lingula anatina]XP_013404446.1 carbohydrate sulfotransferase 12 isoform X2 [Lingula anatina]|eukprot:XP_013404444.1 carbohydrate sulfotransferase 12 isoform X1 [Lingula anatina]